MSDVDQADEVATDQERELRAARAEVARLHLAVRAARRDAERGELSALEVDARARRAEELLEQSLTDLVEERRRERAADLAREQAVAHQAIEQAPPSVPAPPAPVPGPAPDPSPLAGPPAESATFSGGVERVPAPVAAGAAPAALIPADELQQLVQDAVVSGLREALAQAAATMQLLPALGRPTGPDPSPAPAPVVEVVEREPFVQRFLYLDVLLPLVAALIVIVLALAWIG